MRIPALLAGCALLVPGVLPAATQGNEPAYSFRTLLIPQAGQLPGAPRVAPRSWVSGILVTDRMGRLVRPVAVGDGYPAIGTDALLAVAHSDRLVACTLERMAKKGASPHLCLADTDGDQRLDSWFSFFDEIVLYDNVRKLPAARFKPLSAPVELAMIEPAELTDAHGLVGFQILPRAGRLEFCRTYKGENDLYCTHAGPTLDKSGQWQVVALRGAEFRYRKTDNAYEVQTTRPFVAQRFR